MFVLIIFVLILIIAILAGILYFLLAEASPIVERPLRDDDEKKFFSAFSSSYFEAREKFRAAAKLANAQLSSHEVCKDEGGTELDLTIDIAVLNAPPTKNTNNQSKNADVIVHMCGTHGIEGFAGSAIQIRALENIAKDSTTSSRNSSSYDPTRPTIIFVHAVNPFGFANLRRFNENNVDLNRNCLSTPEEWESVLARHPNGFGYERFRPLFHPSRLPTLAKRLLIFLDIAYFLITVGFTKLKTTFVTGQYHDRTGLYHGGTKLEKSWVILREVLTPFCKVARRMVVLDVHSGLGPSGVDTMMCDTKEQFNIATDIWPTGCLIDEPSTGGAASGGYTNVVGGGDIRALCFQTFCGSFASSDAAKEPEMAAIIQNRAKKIEQQHPESKFDLYMHITEEFGTVPPIFVARGVMFENAAFHMARNSPSHRMGQEMSRAAFYVETQSWKENVLRRGLERLDQTVEYFKKH